MRIGIPAIPSAAGKSARGIPRRHLDQHPAREPERARFVDLPAWQCTASAVGRLG